MWLGTITHSHSKILDFKSAKDPVEVWGTFLLYNQSINVNRIRKIKINLNLWLSTDLAPYGKSSLVQ